MTTSTSPCPVCGQEIDALARRCQHCETFLDHGWSGPIDHHDAHRTWRARLKEWLANN